MPLDAIIKKTNIPFSSKEITSPKGAGAKVYADLAKEKIGKVIERRTQIKPIIGVLVANPDTKETQHPIAIVCEFKKKVDQNVIDLVHRLSWNFCRSLLLIIIEPTLVRVFSCYEKPKTQTADSSQLPFEKVEEVEFSAPDPIYNFDVNSDSQETKSALKALQWIELISGNFFNEKKKNFPREQKADKTLLDNLSSIRRQLKEKGLEYDTIHDLLARIIFVQFLFQREDSNGQAAITSHYLAELYNQNELSAKYESLEEILDSYDDSYKFFRILNDRFNGDLFPGNEEKDWEDEMSKVKPEHLQLLANFISGKLRLDNGQFSLWKMYSFDTIPLEFISSIYEEFVSQQQHSEKTKDSKAKDSKREKGVYYTKSHLVDFMLDNVLPWDDDVWDLKILDPSCGSGIFLVKAFQRLVYRWENSLSKKEKDSQDFSTRKKEKVIELLQNNLFGVDIDAHAVRVASFSLYLALCDELDPRTLWQEVTFPNLREKQVVARDFFDEDEPLFKQYENEIKYDLIIGNAPWGKDTIKASKRAKTWAKNNGWDISFNNIGLLFLPKAANLIKKDGYISLIQPTLPLLTAQSSKAEKFRKQIFKRYKIEEIVNLSDLRFVLFEKAQSPSSIITMKSNSPDGKQIQYICPKKRGTDEDYRQIFIDPMDVNFIKVDEAINEPWIWSALMWGNRRDVSLIQQLNEKQTLEKLHKEKIINRRKGIIRGKEKRRQKNEILGKRILEAPDFPVNTSMVLQADRLEINTDPFISLKDSPPLNTFEPSQLFVKASWKRDSWRFQGALINDTENSGVLCSSAYLNIQSEDNLLLKSICLCFNSSLAVYQTFLMDGRCAFYRPEATLESLSKIAIPTISSEIFEKIEEVVRKDFNQAYPKLDKAIYKSFELDKSSQFLIEDFFEYTLSDFQLRKDSIGRQRTERRSENTLKKYCETFFEVINSGFGKDKHLRATIFQERENDLPVRMIAIHLNYPERKELIKIDKYENEKLRELLHKLDKKVMQNESENGNIFYQRVVRIYDNDEGISTIYLIKPDQKRYWLRSQALRDADEVSADIVSWFQQQNISQGAKK